MKGTYSKISGIDCLNKFKKRIIKSKLDSILSHNLFYAAFHEPNPEGKGIITHLVSVGDIKNYLRGVK